MNEGKKKMGNQSSIVYGLGLVGALIYFIQHATGFWLGALGVLKAIVWPAIVVYKALEFLNA
jgi:hypothetical protein